MLLKPHQFEKCLMEISALQGYVQCLVDPTDRNVKPALQSFMNKYRKFFDGEPTFADMRKFYIAILKEEISKLEAAQ